MDKNIVYHYCNLNTFYSIISNKTLRLSDITKSNDQLEITWANSIIRKVFSNSYNVLKDEIQNKLKKEDYMTHVEEKIATVYKGNIIKNLIMDCQSYTKYRPNETTGGIFVSWRRKEELPTGA